MLAESHQAQPQTLHVDMNSDRTLQAFITWDGSLFDFADQCGLTILELHEWWQSETTQSKVKALEALAEARTRMTARLHAPAAVATAARVAEDANVKPPERRRASALVLRHAASRPERRPRKHEASAPDAGQAALETAAHSPICVSGPQAETEPAPHSAGEQQPVREPGHRPSVEYGQSA